MPRYEFLSQSTPPVEIAVEWHQNEKKVSLYYAGELLDNQQNLDAYNEGLFFETMDAQQMVVRANPLWGDVFARVEVYVNGKKARTQRKLDLMSLSFNTYWITAIAIMNLLIAGLWLLKGMTANVLLTFLVAGAELFVLFWLREQPSLKSRNLLLLIFVLDIVLAFVGITPRKWVKLGLLAYFLIRSYWAKEEGEIPEDLARKIEQIGKKET